MNLWRVPIDEGTGHVSGEPEPVTASQQACMLPSLSHNGRQIAYASDGSRAAIEKIGFDPMTGKVFGPATVIVQTSGMMVDCAASRDGKLLVYQVLAPREEFFVVHTDGSDLRRVVGDEHKNRLPQFSPDSSRLAFYSNRGAKYEIWSIGVDGLGLRQETSIPGKPVGSPLWSPSGKMLACQVDDREALIDLTRPLSKRFPQFLPAPGLGASFKAYSWSTNGRWLAGARQRPAGSHEPGILLYSLADKRYVWLTHHGRGPLWLHDSRKILYFEGTRIQLLDTRTGRTRPVLNSPASSSYSDFSLSPDDRTLYLAQDMAEGHIWLLRSFESRPNG